MITTGGREPFRGGKLRPHDRDGGHGKLQFSSEHVKPRGVQPHIYMEATSDLARKSLVAC